MVREISAGGVVIRKRGGIWWVAAIEPAGDTARLRTTRPKPVLALPKGLVDPGEKPLETAVREVYEETGVKADPVTKLGDRSMSTRAPGATASVFSRSSAST